MARHPLFFLHGIGCLILLVVRDLGSLTVTHYSSRNFRSCDNHAKLKKYTQAESSLLKKAVFVGKN
ncbi:MAG: hypothetical protein OSB29_04175, partial [Verrucomicrobiota bacterium]|nr:hypothetical protein [Verrucomicrobiota bacterium]